MAALALHAPGSALPLSCWCQSPHLDPIPTWAYSAWVYWYQFPGILAVVDIGLATTTTMPKIVAIFWFDAKALRLSQCLCYQLCDGHGVRHFSLHGHGKICSYLLSLSVPLHSHWGFCDQSYCDSQKCPVDHPNARTGCPGTLLLQEWDWPRPVR